MSAPSYRRKDGGASLDLSPYVNKKIIVKLAGGRQVRGVLKGYDQLVNLVIDECTESIRGEDGSVHADCGVRSLGLIVVRGPQVMTIAPLDGVEEIENPFAAQEMQ
eukprot:TRINITY_DN2057_c0_g1_i2.p1 TRINITY_DN2057_c0_g1~~TRINITY_DN2057_c0_g1_i2.p1  ORF type:complete len:124 (-),score=23.40 TRINITY_DN2057_c0_g1_i2:68-385(-)